MAASQLINRTLGCASGIGEHVNWKPAVLLVLGQLGCSSHASRPIAKDLILGAADTLVAAESARLGRPFELAVDHEGHLYVADAASSTIVVLDSSGRTIGTVGRAGAGPGEFAIPRSITPAGESLWVADPGNGRFQVLSARGGFGRSFPSPAAAAGGAVAFRADGSAVVALNGRDSALAQRVSTRGALGNRFGRPVAVAPDVWDFTAMKAEIGRGRVPAAFRNVTDPVPARDGGTWLILDAEATILRYDARDSLIWEAALAEPEFGPIREAFFVQNRSDSTPWRLRPLSFFGPGRDVGGTLWVLVRQPEGQPVLILRIGEAGHVDGRLRIPSAVGVGAFAVDPTRRLLYLLASQDATLLRIRLPASLTLGTP